MPREIDRETFLVIIAQCAPRHLDDRFPCAGKFLRPDFRAAVPFQVGGRIHLIGVVRQRAVGIDDQMIVPVGIDGSESGKTLCRRFCGIIEPLCRRIGFALFPRAGTFRKRSGTFGRSIAGICLRLEDYSQQPGLRISERITSPFAVVEELGVFRAGDFLLSIEGFNRFAGPLKKIEPVCGGTVLPPFRKEKAGVAGGI